MIVLLFIFLLAAHVAAAPVDRNKVNYTVRELCAFQLNEFSRAELLLIRVDTEDASKRTTASYTIMQQSPKISFNCHSRDEYVDLLVLGVAPDGKTYGSVEHSLVVSADQRFHAIVTEHDQGDIMTFVVISTETHYARHTP